MEDKSHPSPGIILEEVIIGILAVANEDEVLNHLQSAFSLSSDELSSLKENASRNYKKPQMKVTIKSIKIQNGFNLPAGGRGINCLLKLGEAKRETNEGSALSVWEVNWQFFVTNLWMEKIELEIWQEQEAEQKLNLGRIWLRSLDTFSKKLRFNLRGQNLSPSSCPSVSEANVSPQDKRSEIRSPSHTMDVSTDDNHQLTSECDSPKKRETIHVPESSWVLNAFSTLKRSGNKKFSLGNDETNKERFVDMKSPIPIGPESLVDCPRSWRVKSEKSFFSKCNFKSPDDSKGRDENRKKSEGGGEGGGGDIKAKPEVQVRRQLFRNILNSSSIIQEDDLTTLEGKKIIPESKSLSKLNSVSDFTTIDLSDDSVSTSAIEEFNLNSMKSHSSTSLKYGSLKLSSKNDFQLWKRMSLSLRDKGSDTLTAERNSIPSFENKVMRPLSEDKSKHICSLPEEVSVDTSKIKVKIGTTNVSLRDCYHKMNCSKWLTEKDSILEPGANLKEFSPVKFPKINLSLELECDTQIEPSVPSSEVFVFCLKQFLSTDRSLDTANNEDNGLYLPLSKTSKTILKSVALVYGIPECQISLACWLVLTRSHSIEGTSLRGTRSNKKDSQVRDTPSRKTSSLGNQGGIHPKYLFHWLTKIEAFVSCSSFSEEEEQRIACSVQHFVEMLCRQLRRIHSSFPVDQTSHLAFSLRCVHLLLESKIMHSVLKKCGIEVNCSWPKSNILTAVLTHAKNWVEALVCEVKQNDKVQSRVGVEDKSVAHDSLNQKTDPKTPAKVPVASDSFLLQAVMNGEKAMLAVNDFIGMGEKVYEANFKSELDESYLQLIWPTITSVFSTLLDPIQSALYSKEFRVVFSNVEVDSIKDLHTSLWILLLQMSKLQRFQNVQEKESNAMPLPETYSETFFILCRMWLEICLFHAKETATIECLSDDLSPDPDDGLSSSARELVDLISVMEEKLCRFSFPYIPKFKKNLSTFLEEGINSVIETYQIHICKLSIKLSSSFNNALTPQMGIAVHGIDRVSASAEALVFSLSSRGRKNSEEIFPLRSYTKEASFSLFAKSIPRLQNWITNALTSREREDYLLDWIKSTLDPVLVDYSPTSKNSSVLLRHFWDYVFGLIKEKQQILTQPKDFRVLGNFMDKFHYFYKLHLGIPLHKQTETEFETFMKEIQLKGSSTSEIIHMYFADRLKEQEVLKTGRKPMVINAYFCKDKGLKVEIHMCPYVDMAAKDKDIICESKCDEKMNSSSTLKKNSISNLKKFSTSFSKELLVPNQVRRKAAGVIESIAKSSIVNFYVKAYPVPADWFKKSNIKKTKITQMNPPVFEDLLSFNIKHNDEGVVRGGFLLLRLKFSSLASSGVDSEVILPLKDIPVLSPEEKKPSTCTYLIPSTPTSLKDYESLIELSSRKQDKEANTFIAQLQQAYNWKENDF